MQKGNGFILNNKTFTAYLKASESKRVSQINPFNMLLSSRVSNWVREKKGSGKGKQRKDDPD